MSEIRVPKRTPLSILLLATIILGFAWLPSAHGLTWSSPVEVPAQTDFDVIPSVTEDPSGKLWLAYQSINAFSPPEIYVKTFNGITWTAEQKVTTDAADDTGPSILALNNGTILLFWSSKRSGNFDLYMKSNNIGAWSADRLFSSTPNDETNPIAFQDKAGAIWVVWHRRVASTNFDIFYKTYSAGVWSVETPLTTDTSFDMLPSIAQSKDGRIWVAWASYRTNDFQVWYKTFNGSVWSADTRLTNSNTSDQDPVIIQDRDGTLWVFWSRVINVPPPKDFEEDLYYKTSLDNGATWSADTALFTTLDFDDINPAVGQFGRKLWVYWSSDSPSSFSFNIFYIQSNIITTHDVGITGIQVPPKMKRSDTALINVTVANYGDFIETAQVTLTANSTIIGSTSVSLFDGETKKVTFTWNTLSFNHGKYTLTATVTPVTGETLPNRADNTLQLGLVKLCPWGDVDRDCDVDIIDLAMVAKAYNTRPGDLNWNPAADVNRDGRVDIIDLAVVAKDYGVRIT